MNAEILYCGIIEDGVFSEVTAEEFALKFEEAGFLLLRQYWRNSNKVPSIRYKMKMLKAVITCVLREHSKTEFVTATDILEGKSVRDWDFCTVFFHFLSLFL